MNLVIVSEYFLDKNRKPFTQKSNTIHKHRDKIFFKIESELFDAALKITLTPDILTSTGDLTTVYHLRSRDLCLHAPVPNAGNGVVVPRLCSNYTETSSMKPYTVNSPLLRKPSGPQVNVLNGESP